MAHAFDQRFQQSAARRRFQILDDVRLDAGVADETERVARGAAFRVVIDDDVDRFVCGRHRSASSQSVLLECLLAETDCHSQDRACDQASDGLYEP
jgi:hypothetical protein